MKCSQLRMEIEEFLSGESSGSTETAIEAHLEECADCSNLVVRRVRFLEGSRNAPVRGLLQAALMTEGMVATEESVSTGPRSWSRRRRLATAAAAVLVALPVFWAVYCITRRSGSEVLTGGVTTLDPSFLESVARVAPRPARRFQVVTRDGLQKAKTALLHVQGGDHRLMLGDGWRSESALAGRTGEVYWKLDAELKSVQVTPSDVPRPILAPTPEEGPALATSLRGLTPAVMRVESHLGRRCVVAERKRPEPRAHEPSKTSVWIDAESGSLVRAVDTYADDTTLEWIVLPESAEPLPEDVFFPAAQAQIGRRLDVDWEGFARAGTPVITIVSSVTAMKASDLEGLRLRLGTMKLTEDLFHQQILKELSGRFSIEKSLGAQGAEKLIQVLKGAIAIGGFSTSIEVQGINAHADLGPYAKALFRPLPSSTIEEAKTLGEFVDAVAKLCDVPIRTDARERRMKSLGVMGDKIPAVAALVAIAALNNLELGNDDEGVYLRSR